MTLTALEADALREALDDEYKAWSIYDQVIHDFGEVRPFTNILVSEARHIEALRSLLQRYHVPVPHNSWIGRVPRFDSAKAACEAAVVAELDNAALYERLMASTTRPDILQVFDNLRRASMERHLPAFRRGASRGGGRTGFGRPRV